MASKIVSQLPELPLWSRILLIILASLCFSNSYNGQFVFDDTVAVVNNPDVKDAPMSKVFIDDFWGTELSHEHSHRSYRPLVILTFRFHYWLRGYLDPTDFHLVNIGLHTIVCVLTLFAYKILLGRQAESIAFHAALLFAVHPCHAEAVSGIVGRADVLCTFFVWLSVISYSYCIFTKRRFYKIFFMFLSIKCIAAAMLCKEIGITVIGICGIYDVMIVNKTNPVDIVKFLKCQFSLNDIKNFLIKKNGLLIRLFALSVTGAVLIILRFSIMEFSTPVFQPVDNPASFMDNIVYRVINYNYVYCLNAWLLICPEWLCFDWSMGCIPLISGYDKRIFLVFGLWIIMSELITYAFVGRQNRRQRFAAMGLSLLIVPFLPASNVFLNVGFVLAERTLYLPSAGYCLLIAIGLRNLVVRFPETRIHILFYYVLIILYFTRAWMRSDQWREEKTLYRSALRVCPLNAKVHYNIAKNAADLGDLILAEAEYREALRLYPYYAQALNNLGNLMKERGNYEEAEKLLKHALELQKNYASAWMNLGIVLSVQKKHNESEKSYHTAISYKPVCPDCYYNLGILYMAMSEKGKALKAWEKAIAQKANHRRAWLNLLRLLDDMGMSRETLEAGRKALKFLPEDATVHLIIANTLGKYRRFEEAEVEFKKALSIEPTNPAIFGNFGVLYHRWKKFEDAELMYKKALAIEPNLQSAHENLTKLVSIMRKKLKMKTCN